MNANKSHNTFDRIFRSKTLFVLCVHLLQTTQSTGNSLKCDEEEVEIKLSERAKKTNGKSVTVGAVLGQTLARPPETAAARQLHEVMCALLAFCFPSVFLFFFSFVQGFDFSSQIQ